MIERPLVAFLAAAVAALVSTSSFAQSLALSYQIDAGSQAQRASIANAGCAGFRWVAAVGGCSEQVALGRFSGHVPTEGGVQRAEISVERATPRAAPAPAQPAEAAVIPYLGESSSSVSSIDRRFSALPGGDRDTSQAEFNLRFGAQPRTRPIDEALERRLSDTAHDIRNPRMSAGLEIFVPLHSRIWQSTDPTPPQ